MSDEAIIYLWFTPSTQTWTAIEDNQPTSRQGTDLGGWFVLPSGIEHVSGDEFSYSYGFKGVKETGMEGSIKGIGSSLDGTASFPSATANIPPQPWSISDASEKFTEELIYRDTGMLKTSGLRMPYLEIGAMKHRFVPCVILKLPIA